MRAFQSVMAAAACVAFTCCPPPCSAESVRFYEVTDSFGKYRLRMPPERVVAADWTILENMLELGVAPIGAPELDLYRHYVRQPPLPAGMTDIGLRQSPSLSTLRTLDPEVVLLGTDQKNLSRPILHFSDVMFYNSFSDKYRTNGKKSRVRFLQIAELFQKRELAEQKLAAMDAELAAIKAQLAEHFGGEPPKVTLIRFSGPEKCRVYGANSMPHHTILQLGLETGLPQGRSKFGDTEIGFSKLAAVKQGLIVYVQPVDDPDTLFNSEQWRSLPAVQQNRVRAMAPVWSYGGAMSVLYNARALRDALLNIPATAAP